MTLNEITIMVLGLFFLVLVSVGITGVTGKLFRPSTLRFLRQSGFRNFLNGNFFHFYVYARWTKRYISTALRYYIPKVSLESRKRIAKNYHAKTLTLDQARKVVNLNHDIDVRDAETVIPYPMARDIILSAPPQMALYDCPCREGQENPCQPIQVCMLFGEPIVSFILEHHPHKSRRLTREEALRVLEEEHERGHVHTAWFKNVCLNRFFAICNCCKCCCGAMISMMRHGVPMILPSGFVATIDGDACVGCGTCERSCQFEAVTFDQTPEVVWEKCMGCGVCVDKCPQQAISLSADPKKGVPLEIDTM